MTYAEEFNMLAELTRNECIDQLKHMEEGDMIIGLIRIDRSQEHPYRYHTRFATSAAYARFLLECEGYLIIYVGRNPTCL